MPAAMETREAKRPLEALSAALPPLISSYFYYFSVIFCLLLLFLCSYACLVLKVTPLGLQSGLAAAFGLNSPHQKSWAGVEDEQAVARRACTYRNRHLGPCRGNL